MELDQKAIGLRIRKQREYLGLTRDQLAELLEVTPKFCADLELGIRGMSVSTLCRISQIMKISTDYILFGEQGTVQEISIASMLAECPPDKLPYAEAILKNYLLAVDSKKEQH